MESAVKNVDKEGKNFLESATEVINSGISIAMSTIKKVPLALNLAYQLSSLAIDAYNLHQSKITIDVDGFMKSLDSSLTNILGIAQTFLEELAAMRFSAIATNASQLAAEIALLQRLSLQVELPSGVISLADHHRIENVKNAVGKIFNAITALFIVVDLRNIYDNAPKAYAAYVAFDGLQDKIKQPLND